jgi:hypothetical protein
MKRYLLLPVSILFLFTACQQAARKSLAHDAAEAFIVADSIPANAELAERIDMSTKTPADKQFIKTGEMKFKVSNVLHASEKIEDIAAQYDGYLTYSNLQNRQENYRNSRISRDSLLISKEIVVYNQMELRIPNEQLDSFVRALNPLVVFFDYRTIRLDEVTLQFKANQNRTDRLNGYEKRQIKNIESREARLKETTSAEDQLLARQLQSDDLSIQKLELEDRVNYCNLSIEIYQKPIIVREVIADFNYNSSAKPAFFSRIIDSVVQGWTILEEVILFLVKIWGVILLLLAILFGAKYLAKWYRRIK